ncbi:hypothetical protein ACO0M4_12560 [Streptomyces sp. RGM 3693]|uniref:hypothetical protein n=1 Tax=Streptomyces sp. RGM 3693 TaxID=3413284 RepID=UPI003D265B85
MNTPARTTPSTPAPTSPVATIREQTTPTSGSSLEQALATIAVLADGLCKHLADSQWRAAARIRELAETTMPTVRGR